MTATPTLLEAATSGLAHGRARYSARHGDETARQLLANVSAAYVAAYLATETGEGSGPHRRHPLTGGTSAPGCSVADSARSAYPAMLGGDRGTA